jgi:hypothetical protein
MIDDLKLMHQCSSCSKSRKKSTGSKACTQHERWRLWNFSAWQYSSEQQHFKPLQWAALPFIRLERKTKQLPANMLSSVAIETGSNFKQCTIM